MAKGLTTKAVEKAKPDPKRRLAIPDGLLPGLHLVIQRSGVKSWAIRYRANGKPAKLTLGRFPRIELAKGREIAHGKLEAVAKGEDPAAERRASPTAGPTITLPGTVAALYDLYIERHLMPNGRRWRNNAGPEIENHIRPRLGRLGLEDLTRAHVREIVREIGVDYPVAANRALVRLRPILNWAMAEELIEARAFSGWVES